MITAALDKSADDARPYIEAAAPTHPSLIDSAKKTLTGSVGSWAQGIFGGALKGVSTLATFAFGAFIGLNILVYVLVGGRRIGRWASEHMGPVPPPVGYSILANSARFGLSASIVTRDLKKAMLYTERIQAGVVKVNQISTGLALQAPFGGVKKSSTDSFKEQGAAAVDFYTKIKTVYLDYSA